MQYLSAPTKRVTVMKEYTDQYPDLYHEIYFVGDSSDKPAIAELFVKGSCQKAKSIDKADVVVFGGGSDVDPALYGEKCHQSTFFDHLRDSQDMEAYAYCLENGIPMFGICRGAQFLHVMNGGKLYQDVNNHNSSHAMYLQREKVLLKNVSSVHHQMVIPAPELGMEVLGTSSIATMRHHNDTTTSMGTMNDVEAFFYRDTCCFGVQGHPEYRGYTEFSVWTMKMLEELITMNPDVELRGGYRRIKPSVLAQRELNWVVANEAANKDKDDA